MSDRKKSEQPKEAAEDVPEEAIEAEPEAEATSDEPAAEQLPKGEPINGDAMLVDGAAFINEEASAEPGEGETKVVYRGLADSFEHGGRTYRPDQPVIVPSDVAEDLLTYPNEQFVEAKE